MTLKLFVFFVYLFSVSCFAQNISISGNVKDENNVPIAYANVVLLSLENDSFITGTITDENGAFEIRTLKSAKVVLKVSFLGFEAQIINIDTTKKSDIGVITLKEKAQALDGVTVIAKRPTVKRLVDRLVFNVENSTLSNTNVLDVLKHTPGVLVHDGKITIKNSEPTVYINDRRVHLSSNEVQQLLEGTSATNIKSIEVITNPPAKYEAEGGAVLNVVTSKNIIAGYNGSVFGNYKRGSEYPKYSFGTSHFFKAKKLNTYINYSINPKKYLTRNNEFINFIDSGNIISSWESNESKVLESRNHNINSNIDYSFNKNNSLGLSTNIMISPRNFSKTGVNSNTTVFSPDKMVDSTFNTRNNSVLETFNFAFTLDYLHKFKREGEKLSVSLHHTNYDFSNFQDVNTGYFSPNSDTSFRDNKFQTFSSQIIKLYTGQLDYEVPVSEFAFFESGFKVSNINSESVLDQFSFNTGEKEEDLENSDVFLYDETNYSAYVSFLHDWNKWSLKSGLRVEFTDIMGNSMLSNTTNKNDYFKFFPSFYLINKPNENNEIYFNYKKRINRPHYNQLNPFKYFLNDNAFIIGDPNLKPQIDDVLTLGYTFNKDYTFELYYRYENNPALEIVFQDNDSNKLKYINTNIDRSISYGLDFLTYTNILPNWNVSALSSIYYMDEQFFAIQSNNELRNNKRWSTYIQLVNYFTFMKDKSLLVDVSLIYTSRDAQGASIVSERSGVDLSIKKNILNNKASFSLGVTDVFNGLNFTKKTKYLNQDIFRNTTLENRLLTFGFSYKFGNSKLQNNSKEIDLTERNRLENN